MTKESEVLKDANQKLLNSAFSLEREREFRERERTLKIQIAQLEATLKSDLGEKGSILDKLTSERGIYENSICFKYSFQIRSLNNLCANLRGRSQVDNQNPTQSHDFE